MKTSEYDYLTFTAEAQLVKQGKQRRQQHGENRIQPYKDYILGK